MAEQINKPKVSSSRESGCRKSWEWTIQEVCALVQAKFGKRPCWYQIKTALALYSGKDVIGCAPMGAGKTLSFWIPLLMALEEGRNAMTIVVTPLNLLGKQNEALLDEAGLSGIAVSMKNANVETWKDIENGKYNVVIVHPEILMSNEEVEKLWKKADFTKRLLNFIFDEGHCISQWGSFRKEYAHLGALRYLIPEHVPFYIASATLPLPILLDIIDILQLRIDKTEQILRSNDRPEISLMVRCLVYPANKFQDLWFLIPDSFKEGDTLDPFLVFFDGKKEAENACKTIRMLLPVADQQKIRWFHADLTQEEREELCEKMRSGEVFGLFCTDAFGMGMDLPNIKIVVQWKATCTLCTLWQRFGRGARGPGQTGMVVLLVEMKDTDEERKAKAKKVIAAALKKSKEGIGTGSKRKSTNQLNPTAKRPALTDRTTSVLNQATDIIDSADPILPNTPTSKGTPEETLKETKRAHYAKRARKVTTTQSSVTKGKDKVVEVGSAMDDFINAHLHFKCRRVVPMLVFGNDQRRALFRSILPLISTHCNSFLSYQRSSEV
ncbi:P-loop containing nucleoside triphosphate hydrolase protein [Phlegmacium glaucopus]|nr:P-loop containing nucleoside triphosphate hydrolase protein [Phlegmacium glaucopus]